MSSEKLQEMRRRAARLGKRHKPPGTPQQQADVLAALTEFRHLMLVLFTITRTIAELPDETEDEEAHALFNQAFEVLGRALALWFSPSMYSQDIEEIEAEAMAAMQAGNSVENPS